jgi:hypothetical protein
MNQRLIDTLGSIGKHCLPWHGPDGSEVLLLPYGGRVLGLFAAGSQENFFWTHPALESAASAAEFYQGRQWHNSGGDRTWLAPEVDFFFPRYPKTDVYHQPRDLDPGNYRVVQDGEGECLVNRATYLLSRCQARVELEIAKRIGPAPNPLRNELGPAALRKVEYAGYTQRTSLRWLDAAGTATPVGLWNLLQMPHGGELLVATYGRTEPKVFFGTVRPQDVRVENHGIRYCMSATGEQKIGIRAVAAVGRVGYRYPERDGRWSLIVRNVFVDPSGSYVDVPWNDPDDPGYAVQACNVNSGLGSFSELEYHVPAIGPGTGRMACEDVSQVWAFRGSRTEIDGLANALLAPNLEPHPEKGPPQ